MLVNCHIYKFLKKILKKTAKLIQPFHTHTHLSNTIGYFETSNELRYFINGFIQKCKKRNKENGSRYLENFCYLNREEDVRVLNFKHHSKRVKNVLKIFKDIGWV